MKEEYRHCDSYINDHKQPICLRLFLLVQRMPASDKMVMDEAGVKPRLFADFNGRRVRVVMASRFGDVGITRDLEAEYGYTGRVPVSMLSNFSDQG